MEKKLGRNQKIAICGYGLPLLMTYVLVWVNKLSGPEFVSYLQIFVPIAMGTVLGVAGVIKTAQVIKDK